MPNWRESRKGKWRICTKHKQYSSYQRPSVDVPEIEPRSSAGHYVASELVDGHGSDGADVGGEVFDVAVPGEVPDDCGAVARAGDSDAPIRTGCEAGDGVCMTVEHLLDQQLFHFLVVLVDGDDGARTGG